ncbi:hypothetical protein [Natrinema sp. DC36]|uniref:hypothetical protein n=1 Tax=Natrinema sp. DC36 TaxID=2878680 RepID=UPI001CF056D0|nr:hypothetical protein [Natrinema sp. DC36]
MIQEQAGKSLDEMELVAEDSLEFDEQWAGLPITQRMRTVSTSLTADLNGTGLE